MKSWEDDLFDRHGIAVNLVSYCRSVASHGVLLDEGRSIVIGVDADYGLGKTFFLKGLMIDAAHHHPVAYIDAWSDDLIDEPLIALAAVLQSAVKPLLESDPRIKARWKDFVTKTGKVLWIGGKGLAKRGAQVAITGAAVDEIADIVQLDEGSARDNLSEAMKEAVDNTVRDVEDELKALENNELLSKEIERFQAGQNAIEDMKRSLHALVNSIEGQGQQSPVFIIIDELDRCRPSYAIKLLEELKHLFSVPGVVFVLGVNTTQLSKAISGVYGSSFSGESYLDRFIDRRIVLPFPPLILLVRRLWEKISASNRLIFPKITDMSSSNEIGVQEYISLVLEFHSVSPRKVFKFFDRLQTSLAISGQAQMDGVYLIEKIAKTFSDEGGGGVRGWQFGIGGGYSQWQWVEAEQLVSELDRIYSLPIREARKMAQGDSPFDEHVAHFLTQPGEYGPPTKYNVLLNDVGVLGS